MEHREIKLLTVAPSADHGVLIGYALVSHVKDVTGAYREYYDLHGDHVPDESLFEAGLEFAKSGRKAFVQHGGEDVGTIDFMFPLTADVAKALGIDAQRLGLLVGMRLDDPKSVVDSVALGQLTGFSIGYQTLESEDPS